MEKYIGHLRENGYTSLKDQYYMDQATDYPSLDKQTSDKPNADMNIDTVDRYNDDHNEEAGEKVEKEIEEKGGKQEEKK